MKYLKTFDKVKEEDIDDIDIVDTSKITKYVVWFDSIYHILLLINDNGYTIITPNKNEVMVNDYLFYQNGKFKTHTEKCLSHINIDSSSIAFRSNDLEECKEYIILNADQNKFNL